MADINTEDNVIIDMQAAVTEPEAEPVSPAGELSSAQEESPAPEIRIEEPKKKGKIYSFLRKDTDEDEIIESKVRTFSKEEYILTHLPDEDLMEYLRMTDRQEEKRREDRAVRNTRIFSLLQTALIAAAVVAVVWFMRDDPVVLTNVLYISGILLVLWFLKKTKH